jgi:hypothetical protein
VGLIKSIENGGMVSIEKERMMFHNRLLTRYVRVAMFKPFIKGEMSELV